MNLTNFQLIKSDVFFVSNRSCRNVAPLGDAFRNKFNFNLKTFEF